MNILILDDEAETRSRVARLLSRRDSVWQAENGLEGLELISANDIDLILTDICMPKMDGLEFLQSIRSKGYDTVAIVMSGYNDFEYAHKAIKYSVLDYLLKPISPQELIKLVDKARKINEENEYRKQFGIQPFLNSLYNGNYSRQEAREKMEILNIDPSFDYTIAGYVRVKDHDISIETVSDILKENAPDEIVPYVFLRGRSFALFITVKDITRTYIREKMEKLRERASKDARLSGSMLWMGLSSPAFTVSELKEKDREAELLYRTTLFINPFEAFDDRNMGIKVQRIQEEADILSEKVLSLVISDTAPENMIDEYFRLLSSAARLSSYAAAEDRIALLIQRLMKISRSNIIADRQSIIEKELQECRTAGNLYDTKNILVKTIKHMQSEYREENIPISDVITETIQRRVRQNLSNEAFSVQDAINGLNYSENYIRYIFSNSSGMTIKEYITSERMKHAAALLIDGKAVKEVAEASGFSNQRYFAKCFKDFYGMTPTEYRDSDLER